MSLLPAEPDSGIKFRRSDFYGGPVDIDATWRNAVETPLCTTLVGRDGAKVSTVEHLLSAFYGCGIDNALVEISGGEVPAMDGSAAPFVFLIRSAGCVRQGAPRRAIKVLKTVTVRDGVRSVSLAPGGALSVDFEIRFDNPLVGRQALSIDVSPESYESAIAPARTFGFLADVAWLHAQGLARGGSLENAIVIGETRILNDGGLRFEDEFVRHKVLDAIGDLYLAGGPIVGTFRGRRAGHSLNLRLLQALFSDESAWCWCELGEQLPQGRMTTPARAVAAPW
jgi:UDP-3-O-[3-hydroxymyristoyl] N-acetylglucosamine deacetylase